MRTGKGLAVPLMITALTVLCVLRVDAADSRSILPEEGLSLETIKGFFDAAFLEAKIDEDGDLRIEDGGLKTFIRINTEKMMITYFSIWRLKSSVSEDSKLAFVNRLNDELILVRFCMPNTKVLWCDYQFSYDGGITPAFIIQTYRTFAKVVRGTAITQDPDDIIGWDRPPSDSLEGGIMPRTDSRPARRGQQSVRPPGLLEANPVAAPDGDRV